MDDMKFKSKATKRAAEDPTSCWEKCQANKTKNGKTCKAWMWQESSSKPCRLYTKTKSKSASNTVAGVRDCHPVNGI